MIKILKIILLLTILFLGNSPMYSQQKMNDSLKSFYTSNGKLFDGKGNEFIIRGTSNPHIWFYRKSLKSLDKIAQNKCNTVRVVWQTKGSARRLRKILQKTVELRLIAIPEIHDFTGDDKISGVEAAAKYWARDDIKAVLNDFKPYILINIANEWMGKWDDKNWFEGYKSAIAIMRNAGLDQCLVIDGAGWGQDINPIKNFGHELIQLDPQHNLLFDVHIYGSWNDSDKIVKELNFIHDNKIPLVVGEFGFNFNNGKNNLTCKVDAALLIKTCQQLGIGYMPWSWCGNNKENQWLDLVSHWKDFTPWGNLVFNSADGIKNTSKPCSIF
jgi:mannan endo-1,4-beta-mannosidase